MEKRIWQHNNDIGVNYTKASLPVYLVYYEEYIRIDGAFYREKQIQGWSRKKKLALIKGKPELLPKLAKKNFQEVGGFGTFRVKRGTYRDNLTTVNNCSTLMISNSTKERKNNFS